MNDRLDSRPGFDPLSMPVVREMLDHHEITKLLSSYVHAADDCRWDDWACLFTADAAVHMPQVRTPGRNGLAQWAGHSLAGFQSMMHFSGNHDIHVSEDTATSRSKVIAVCVPDVADRERHLDVGRRVLGQIRAS